MTQQLQRLIPSYKGEKIARVTSGSRGAQGAHAPVSDQSAPRSRAQAVAAGLWRMLINL
jgi:hypothetical protein